MAVAFQMISFMLKKNACKKDVTNNYVTQIIDFVFLNYST